jgi:hypothetical protein
MGIGFGVRARITAKGTIRNLSILVIGGFVLIGIISMGGSIGPSLPFPYTPGDLHTGGSDSSTILVELMDHKALPAPATSQSQAVAKAPRLHSNVDPIAIDAQSIPSAPLVDPWSTTNPTIPINAEQLFEGVYYVSDERLRDEASMIDSHLVFIDLQTPGIEFLATPCEPTDGNQLPARTTSQFLTEFGLQLAINGSGFSPWYYESPDDYFPHVGDWVTVTGFASSRGDIYSTDNGTLPTLYLSRDNRAQFNAPAGEVYNAIAGHGGMILENGIVPDAVASNTGVHPRTAVALDTEARTLILIVVNGRMSRIPGVTLAELAGIIAEYGGDSAMNLDGGGSSALIAEGGAGEPMQLNLPIHAGMPGTERPVANHLGIYARRPTELMAGG